MYECMHVCMYEVYMYVCVYVCVCMYICMYTTCIFDAIRSQEKVSVLVEVELQKVVSCCVGSRNQTQGVLV